MYVYWRMATYRASIFQNTDLTYNLDGRYREMRFPQLLVSVLLKVSLTSDSGEAMAINSNHLLLPL